VGRRCRCCFEVLKTSRSKQSRSVSGLSCHASLVTPFVAADVLQIPALDLARLLDKRERASDRTFVIDVVAALVHEGGVDPRWLLTGEYDGNVHRQALLLGEDRGAKGRSAVREFVEQQYQGLKRESILAWRPWRKAARPKQPVTKPKVRSA